MKKQAKPTRKDKVADKKVEKQKGPVPDFKPNHERAQVRQHQVAVETARMREEREARELAALIAEKSIHFTDFVQGRLGEYLVGINSEEWLQACGFTTYVHEFKATETKSAHECLVIQEVYATENIGEPVFIPHAWLFKKLDKVFYTHGKKGEVQRMMLTYLQTILFEEISVEKEIRAAAHKAKQKAQPVDHEHEQQELAEA